MSVDKQYAHLTEFTLTPSFATSEMRNIYIVFVIYPCLFHKLVPFDSGYTLHYGTGISLLIPLARNLSSVMGKVCNHVTLVYI